MVYIQGQNRQSRMDDIQRVQSGKGEFLSCFG